jgi:hypothetical protein
MLDNAPAAGTIGNDVVPDPNNVELFVADCELQERLPAAVVTSTMLPEAEAATIPPFNWPARALATFDGLLLDLYETGAGGTPLTVTVIFPVS